MGLVDRVRASASTPTKRYESVSTEEFANLLGLSTGNVIRTKAGVTIGPKRALGITAWYSGVRYISEVCASLPVHTYQDRNDERTKRADPPWLVQPDVEQTWFGLVEFWLMSLLHRGNAFAYKVRGSVGQVVGLREIHPDRITTGIAPDGTKRFLVDHDPTPYTTRDILHIPGLSWDGRFGLNPIQYAADSLGAVAATDDYAQRYFASGTHVGGIISVPQALTNEQAKEHRHIWDQFHQGLENAHKTGVLSLGATYQRLALNAAESQLIEARQYGVSEVARLLRLPPHKLYDLTHATFSNIEHQSIEATTDGIQPWVDRIEANINADRDLVPVDNFIEFSLEGRLRGDTASRFAAYSQAVGRPWMTPNEVRRLDNQAPLPNGDELLMPLNMGNPAGDGSPSPKEIAEMVQKIYLGVGTVISDEEARKILTSAGADLPGSIPGGVTA